MGRKKRPKARSAEQRRGKASRKPGRNPTKLSLDPEAVARGEEYGRRHGKSLSQLVSDFLRSLPTVRVQGALMELAPPVRRLYGVAAGADADRDAHRVHVVARYTGGSGSRAAG